MFRAMFSCFRRQPNPEMIQDYRRMKSSVLEGSNVEDIYGRGSIAIRNSRSSFRESESQDENEEIRVVTFGPITEYFERSSLPPELPKHSRKVARIGLGANHVVFLFVGCEVAI